MKRAIGSFVFAALAFAPASARAQSVKGAPAAVPQDEASLGASYPVTPKKRDGFVIGTAIGVSLVGASGYPNDSTKIGDPNYYGASGVMVGSQEQLFLMGALADYLNFGFWVGGSIAQNGDWRSRGTAGGFRVEAFPLFKLVPQLSDLGVLAQFGIGGATLDAKRGPYPGADGVQSMIGVGVFYEWSIAKLLGGHAAIGPSFEYDTIFSRSIDRDGAVASVRLVWYGGM
jgi:hypothetical protein